MSITPAGPLARGQVTRRTEWRWLIILVSVLFVVKLTAALLLASAFHHHVGSYQVGRVDYYNSLAKNVAYGHGYRFTTGTSLTLMREPGYPYLLAVLVHYFDNYLNAAIALNVFLSCLSALLIGRLAARVWDAPWVSVAAAALFLVHPGVTVAESRLGIELPYILLLLCFFLALRRALQTRRLLEFCAAGAVLGLVCLVRSTPLLFPAVIALYLMATASGATRIGRSLAQTTAMVAACLLVLSPWIIRNYRLVHKFIPTASVQGVAMQTGLYKCENQNNGLTYTQVDAAAAEARNVLARQQGYRFLPGYYQFFYDPRDEVAFNSGLSHDVMRSYLHSPALLLRCGSENLLNFWFRSEDSSATLGAVLVQVPYLILAAIGLLMGWTRAERSTLVILLLFMGYSIAVCLPIQGQARYSIPMVPILAILGALPITQLLTAASRYRAYRRVPGGAGTMGSPADS